MQTFCLGCFGVFLTGAGPSVWLQRESLVALAPETAVCVDAHLLALTVVPRALVHVSQKADEYRYRMQNNNKQLSCFRGSFKQTLACAAVRCEFESLHARARVTAFRVDAVVLAAVSAGRTFVYIYKKERKEH